MLNKEILVTISENDKKIASESEDILCEAMHLTINNNEEFVNSANFLKKIKTKSFEIEEIRKSITKPLDEVKQLVMSFFKPNLDQLCEAEKKIKEAVKKFNDEQEIKRLETEKKLRELAKKEEETKIAELNRQSEELKIKGFAEQAEELKNQAQQVFVTAPTILKETPKVSGVSFKEVWNFTVTDFSKLPDEYKLADNIKLGKIAKALKGTFQIPGVMFHKETCVSAGKV